MESWRTVWRAAAPLLPLAGLEALAEALRSDDPRLLQAATTSPPPLSSVADWPVEAACLLGYCGWQGSGLNTVAEVDEYFGRICHAIDQAVNEPAGVRHLLNHYDETPRAEMIANLLPEVDLELQRRQKEAAA